MNYILINIYLNKIYFIQLIVAKIIGITRKPNEDILVPLLGAVVEVGVSVVGSRSLPVLQFSVVQKQKVSLISPIM